MNPSTLELSRKYFAHALVLIDSHKEKKVQSNVVRALWGLIKTLKAIDRNLVKAEKIDPKNTKMIEITQERIRQIYEQKTDIDVGKMSMMN